MQKRLNEVGLKVTKLPRRVMERRISFGLSLMVILQLLVSLT